MRKATRERSSVRWTGWRAVIGNAAGVARYGDAWIDVAHRRGVGIDGCTVRDVRTNGQTVDVVVDDKVARSAPPEIALAKASEIPVRILIDGKMQTTVLPGTVRAPAVIMSDD